MTSNPSEIRKQLKELVVSEEKLRESKYGRTEIKEYRKLYVDIVEKLADHISVTKNKRLGEEAKELLHFNKVYRNMQLRTGILAAGISLTFVLIVYLYMMEEMTTLYIVSAGAAVGAFLMIRYTTQFSVVLDEEVKKVSKVSKKLMRHLGS